MPAVTESPRRQASPLPVPSNGVPASATSGSSPARTGVRPDQRRSRADFVRRFHLSRLRVHLVLLLLVAFVPTAGLLLRTTLEARHHEAAGARQDALRWARVLAGEHEGAIETARQLLTMLAQLPDVRQQRPDRCNAFVTDLLRRYPRYANLGAVTLNGSVFCGAAPAGEPIDLAGRAHFWRAVENGGLGVDEYRVDRATGRATVNVSYPLIDDTGSVQGAVFAAIDLTWLMQLPALARLPAGATFAISDRQGRVRLRFPDPARWVGQMAWDKPVVDQIAALGEGSAETAGPDGIARFVGFTPLPSADGGDSAYLAVAIPHDPALAVPDRALARNLAALGLIATLALIAARVIGNRVVPCHIEALGGAPAGPRAGGPDAHPESKPLGRTSGASDPSPERAKLDPRPERERGGERRQSPRDPVSWPVRVWCHAGWAAVGRVVDASISGVRIAVAGTGRSDLLELGGRYRVEVLAPGMTNGFIRVGELRHVGDRTIGLSLEEELPSAAMPRGPAASRFLTRIA